MFDLFELLSDVFTSLTPFLAFVIAVAVVWGVVRLFRGPAAKGQTEKGTHVLKINDPMVLVVIGLFALTQMFSEQLRTLLFPGKTTGYVLGGLVIDIALIVIALILSRWKTISITLLVAGLLRFVLIFFQLQGIDPVLRAFIIFLAFVGLMVVGLIKFGHSLAKEER
jgi:hypothetical protein